MIERIPDQIPIQTGEWRGTTFDIIPKETFAMACRKINELVDTVNRLEESVQGVVNNSIADGGRIQSLQEQIHALKTRPENVQSDPKTRPVNVCEPITLIDMFNEMGRLYADLWNKMEDIHHDIKTKGDDNE